MKLIRNNSMPLDASVLLTIQAIESHVGRDLPDEMAQDIADYLQDNPACTDIDYLVDLFTV